MEIRSLVAFARSYEARSFTAAAQEEFVTRQAMSKAIAQLEAELGTLFVREARGISPTPLARSIYPHVQTLLESYDLVLANARRHHTGQLGPLALACEPGAMLTLPPHLLESYREARPDVELSCSLMPVPIAAKQLAERAVDAVVASPLPLDDALFAPLLSSGLVIVFTTATLTPCDLAGLRHTENEGLVAPVELLTGKTILGVSPLNHVECKLPDYLAAHGVEAVFTYEYGDSMLGQNAMLEGAGGLIVEEGAAWRRFDQPGFVLVPLADPDAPRWLVGISWLPDCANAARVEDFAAFAAREAKRLA